MLLFFFFQAEDGIRDYKVTGVQTCALPIFSRVARLVPCGQQRFPAARAAAVLRPEEPDGGLVRWRGHPLAPPVGPVAGQGRVVGGRPAVHRDVADDVRPGELGEVGAGIPVAEHAPVLPGLVEPAEVPGRDPAPRLVRVRVPGPPVGDMPDMVVQPGEHPAGDTAPVVGRPAPDNGVQPVHDGRRVSRSLFTGSLPGVMSSLPLPCRSTWRRMSNPRNENPSSAWTIRVLTSLKDSPR